MASGGYYSERSRLRRNFSQAVDDYLHALTQNEADAARIKQCAGYVLKYAVKLRYFEQGRRSAR